MYRTALLLLTAVLASAESQAWKIEIDNTLVQVGRTIVPPHVALPPVGAQGLLVFLTDYSVRVTGEGQRELKGGPHEVLWFSSGQTIIQNLGGKQLEVLCVTPKLSPEPDASSFKPVAKSTLKFENDLIRVRQVRAPVAPVLSKNHLPGVAIFLGPAHIRYTYAEGRVDELHFDTGQIGFNPGGPFTFENLGADHEVMWIDLKTHKQVQE